MHRCFLLIQQGNVMFKVSRILLIAGLLATQSNLVKAGGPGESQNFARGLKIMGMGVAGTGIIIGGIGALGLYKSFQWAQYPQGPQSYKRYIGRTILGTASVATIFGASYFYSQLNRNF
jgi:hypothetical protein